MGQKDYNKLVENKAKLPENSKCVDCDTANPLWASVKYGTFFALGVYLDFVVSVNLNVWNKESYLPIQYGENANFIKYLIENNLDSIDRV